MKEIEHHFLLPPRKKTFFSFHFLGQTPTIFVETFIKKIVWYKHTKLGAVLFYASNLVDLTYESLQWVVILKPNSYFIQRFEKYLWRNQK